MESIYNATLHGTAASQHNNLTSSSLKPQRTIIQSLALKAAIKEKERKNPIPIKQVNTYINQLDGMLSRQEDILWLLLRYRNKDNQVTPGWKGFFYETPKKPLIPILLVICLLYASHQQRWILF